MHFPPFSIPFQSFFSPNMLFGHIFAPPPPRGVKQKNIHPWFPVSALNYWSSLDNILGANAPLGPASSEGLYVCMYVCMYVCLYVTF